MEISDKVDSLFYQDTKDDPSLHHQDIKNQKNINDFQFKLYICCNLKLKAHLKIDLGIDLPNGNISYQHEDEFKKDQQSEQERQQMKMIESFLSLPIEMLIENFLLSCKQRLHQYMHGNYFLNTFLFPF